MQVVATLNATQVALAREVIETFRFPQDPIADSLRIVAAGDAAYEELGLRPLGMRVDFAVLMRADQDALVGCDDFTLAALTRVHARHAEVGTPFGVAEESSDLFQSIMPKEGAAANTNAALGEFKPHTDNAACPEYFRPEWISLTCSHNEAHAETGLVSAELLLNSLPPELRKVALQSRFTHVVPPSFGAECSGSSEPRPLFWEKPDGIFCAMTTYRTSAYNLNDRVAEKVITTLEEIAMREAAWVDLQPGDFLFFRNDKSLHARRAINGTRKLIRAYYRKSLGEMRVFAGIGDPYIFSAAKALKTSGVMQ